MPCTAVLFYKPHNYYYRNFYLNFKYRFPFSPQRKRAVYMW